MAAGFEALGMNADKWFQAIGNSPDHWRYYAEALAFNAELLKAHRYQRQNESDVPVEVRVNRTLAELLLWGYAVEAFLKCLRLKRGKLLVDKKGQFIGRKDHDLVQIARNACYPLGSSEEGILRRLATVTQWRGRYPIATKATDSFTAIHWSWPEDDKVLDGLIESLRRQVE